MTERYYGLGDNVEAIIDAPVAPADTIISVMTSIPYASVDLPCIATLHDPSVPGNYERVIIRSISTSPDTLTVERSYGGDTALSFPNPSVVTLRVMSKHMQDVYDVAIMQVQASSYAERTLNVDDQIISVDIYEDSSKSKKLVQCTYTYDTVESTVPNGAVRLIYRDDGTTVRVTETSTFTELDGEILTHERVIS